MLVFAVQPAHARRLLGLALSLDDWRTSAHNIAERFPDPIDGLVAQVRSD
jgi:hypothetical protein